jgi:uncharacterized integral membrane protein (TIGR00698 family)
MVLYPLIARLLHLSPALAGLFLGGTIHDVAQVVGAGYTLGPETGDAATIVKLFRVALLTVVVVLVSASVRRAHATRAIDDPSHAPTRQPLMPWFLWLFIGMVALNSAGAFGAAVQGALGHVARGCLVVAIAALGMKTSFMQLARAGWKPFVLILAETLFLALLVLGVIVFLR